MLFLYDGTFKGYMVVYLTINKENDCNTNIQIGDASQVFTSTLYTSKSTQEEDNEKQIRTGRAVIKRIKRVLEETSETIIENPHDSHLTELKHPTIPKISLPRDKLCPTTWYAL